MKNLVIVTDHKFYCVDNKYYDNYVFDYAFFDDYRNVFENIYVVARVKQETSTEHLKRSDGEGITFLPIADIHGLKWFFSKEDILKGVLGEIHKGDAYCFRIPSIASWHVYKAIKHSNKPYIFELIGDPETSLVSSSDSFIKKVAMKIIGKRASHMVSSIVKGAVGGSYVSIRHLQNKYPMIKEGHSDSISSIRLPASKMLEVKMKKSRGVPFTIVHVGSFVPVKNQGTIIKAVKLLKDSGIDVKLYLLGDGALKEQCIALATDLGINHQVSFEGHVTGIDNINRYLDMADLFVLPSTSEGMPRSMIEAMARGIPCIGTNVSGINELLGAEYLFAIDDSAHLAKLVTTIQKNKTMWEGMSKHSIDTANSFSQDKLSRKREQLLQYLKSKAL